MILHHSSRVCTAVTTLRQARNPREVARATQAPLPRHLATARHVGHLRARHVLQAPLPPPAHTEGLLIARALASGAAKGQVCLKATRSTTRSRKDTGRTLVPRSTHSTLCVTIFESSDHDSIVTPSRRGAAQAAQGPSAAVATPAAAQAYPRTVRARKPPAMSRTKVKGGLGVPCACPGAHALPRRLTQSDSRQAPSPHTPSACTRPRHAHIIVHYTSMSY
jgi:hypothetical protein